MAKRDAMKELWIRQYWRAHNCTLKEAVEAYERLLIPPDIKGHSGPLPDSGDGTP